MAGLNLGLSAGFATPQPALPPSMSGDPAGATISSRAYGIASQGGGGGGRTTAAYGSIAITTVSAVALVWLWWTLPH